VDFKFLSRPLFHSQFVVFLSNSSVIVSRCVLLACYPLCISTPVFSAVIALPLMYVWMSLSSVLLVFSLDSKFVLVFLLVNLQLDPLLVF